MSNKIALKILIYFESTQINKIMFVYLDPDKFVVFVYK
jgi:hypothetical protein